MLDWLSPKGGDPVTAHPLFIGGKWLAAEQGATFPDLDPTTGAEVALVADASAADLEAAISAAVAAQAGWAGMLPAARAEVFHRAAELFAGRQEALVDLLVRETGSGRGKAAFEASLVPLALREAAALTTRSIGEVMPSQMPGKFNRTIRKPAGVVGVITPWNFPLYLTIRAFVHAMALGNTVVLKPSEDSPITGGLALAELFADAGLPEGVLNVVTTAREGAAMVGESFVNDHRIAVISFTGSSAVGQRLAQGCAARSKKITLEMGGKNPIVVRHDADLDRAVEIAGFAAFLHQGQICLSADRLIVHESLYPAFVEKLVERARAFVPTPPDDPYCVNGPIINARQLKRIEELIDSTREAGATVQCGGASQAPYYEATVLTGVTTDMPVWKDEIFGPATIVIPFSTDEEAIALANDTEYGLTASVLSADTLAAEIMAEQINAGMVHVNDSPILDEPHCPFSGLGRSGGGGKWGPLGAIESFTVQRWISVQRVAHPMPF